MKICFIMINAYYAFTGIDGRRSGSEVQMARLASELIKMGHSISLISFAPIEFDKKESSIRILRLSDPWKHLWRPKFLLELLFLMHKSDSDIFIVQNFLRNLPFIALFSKLLNRYSIFCTSSKADLDGTKLNNFLSYDIWLLKNGIRFFDQIVVQTEEHKKMLSESYGEDSMIIPNGIDINFWRSYPLERNSSHVLWIGNIRRIKRFDKLIEIAANCPNVDFTAIGSLRDDYSNLVNNLPKNLRWVGIKNESEVQDYLRKCALLLNTSDIEGLPNTFLEAWAIGRPVFSMGVDVDGKISNGDLGRIFLTTESMARGIREFLKASESVKEDYKKRTTNWVEEQYSIGKIVEKWEGLLINIISGKKSNYHD